MKKLFFIFIIILFLFGIYKNVSAEDEISDYKTVQIYKDYEFEYVNNKTIDITFDGYVLYDDVYLDGYSKFCIYASDIYLIFSKYNNLSKFIKEEDNNYKTIYSKSTIYFDAYDYISSKCQYNYVYIAKHYNFDAKSGERISGHDYIRFKAEMYNENINFKKGTTAYVPNGYYMNPYDENDYAWFLGIVSMYPYNIELLDEVYEDNVILKFKITDSIGNIKYRDLKVIWVIDAPPVIIAEKDIIPIDINNPKSYDDIKKYFKAIDQVEGDVSANGISFESDYDNKNPIVGEYNSIIYAQDYEGYTSSMPFKIIVFDPTDLIKNYNIKLSYTKEYEYDEIMMLAGLKEGATYDVLEEYYTEDYTKLGKSIFNVKIYNEYGFDFDIDLNIEVIDDKAPIIKTNTINISANTELTDEEILSNASIDDYSKVNIEIIKDNFINNTIGSYEIFIKAVDEYNNASEEKLIVNVINSSNINYYNNTIRVYNDYAFSENEIINFLRDISNNDYKDDTTSTVVSNYFDMPLVAGTYQATLITILSSGEEIKEEYTIEVLAVKKAKKKKKKNIFRRIWEFILYIIKLIINLIKKIFKLLFH